MKERLRIGNEHSMWIDLVTSDLKQSFENGLPDVYSIPQPHANVR